MDCEHYRDLPSSHDEWNLGCEAWGICLNHPETPEPSQYSSYRTSDTLPPARSLSVNPSTLPTSRFSGSDQPSEYTPTPSHSVDTRNHIPGRDKTVKFWQMENDDSLSLLSDSEEEDIDGNKKLIPKPRGEPGRPGSGGYKLENALGRNKATFETIMVSWCTTAYDNLLKGPSGLHSFISVKEAWYGSKLPISRHEESQGNLQVIEESIPTPEGLRERLAGNWYIEATLEIYFRSSSLGWGCSIHERV